MQRRRQVRVRRTSSGEEDLPGTLYHRSRRETGAPPPPWMIRLVIRIPRLSIPGQPNACT